MEAMSRQGYRSDLTSCQVGTKLRTDEIIAENSTDSARQIQRYIRLTNLIPELLDLVDEERIAFTPAVELSYLNEVEQADLVEEIRVCDATPNLSQAQRLRAISREEGLTPEHKCFVTSACVSAKFGLSIQKSRSVELTNAIINNSKTVYGLYPVEKIGFDSIISICPANKLNYIITDSDSSEDDLMQFEEIGVKIKIAE